MPALPAAPVRVTSFTDRSTAYPTLPPPGNLLDAEFDRTNAAVAALISFVSTLFQTDGSLKPNTVSATALTADIIAQLTTLSTAAAIITQQGALKWAEYIAGPVIAPADAPAAIAASNVPSGLFYDPVAGGPGGLFSAKYWALQAQAAVNAFKGTYGAPAPPPSIQIVPLAPWTFNNTQTAFTLSRQDNGQLVTPAQSALLVFLNGYLQVPGQDFTVAGSTLTFTRAPYATEPHYVVWLSPQAATSTNPDHPSLRDFGALGNGVADDTAAWTAALAAMPAGGTLFVPPGTYRVTSTINVTQPSIHIEGAGRATSVLQDNANQGVFNVTGTDARIEGLLLGYPDGVTPNISTVALDTSSVNGRYNHLGFYNVATGAHVTGEATAQFFHDIVVIKASSSCFWADNTSDLQISNFLFLPGGADAAGASWAVNGAFRMTGWIEGLVATSGEIFGGLHSLSLAGVSLARGACPAFCQFADVYFDSAASFGVLLTYAIEITFSDCWIAGGRTPGAGQPGAQIASVQGIGFTGTRFVANGSHGLVLAPGAVDTSVKGCTFNSNGGNVTAGTVAGIVVSAGVGKFQVSGSRFGNGIILPPTGGVQQYGVVVLAGASDHYRIEGNTYDASLGGAGVVDAGAGTDKQVEVGVGNRGALVANDLTLATDASQTAMSGAWTQTTPAIAAQAGTFGAASATLRYKKVGRTVNFSLHGTVTTVGSASAGINITMPFASVWDACFSGKEIGLHGKVISGELQPGGTTLTIDYFDNTSVIEAGAVFVLNGTYEAAA